MLGNAMAAYAAPTCVLVVLSIPAIMGFVSMCYYLISWLAG